MDKNKNFNNFSVTGAAHFYNRNWRELYVSSIIKNMKVYSLYVTFVFSDLQGTQICFSVKLVLSVICVLNFALSIKCIESLAVQFEILIIRILFKFALNAKAFSLSK